MRVALINTNRMKPPIAPIGLEYVAEALASMGHHPEIIDLCWAEDWKVEIAQFFSRNSFGLIGVTLRNTDDCAFGSRQSFIEEFIEIIRCIRNHSDALIIIGGIGFSIMSEEVISRCPADAGLKGDGEFSFPSLVSSIEKGEDWHNIPGLVFLFNGNLHHNTPEMHTLNKLPRQSRSWVDNRRYFELGGQGGIETKRGCSQHCIYCPEPAAKGKVVRVRPPEDVFFEIKNLHEQGIDHLHTCDSEFNIPEEHALEICREISENELGEKLRWYAYCSPVPFSRELAMEMRRAGCAGINFGIDSGDDRMLRRLKRSFTTEDIIRTVQICRETGIVTMLDLLLGAPGENEESIRNTVEFVRRTEAERVGISAGVRVYPGTALSEMIASGTLDKGFFTRTEIKKDLSEPLFFIEPALGQGMFELLDRLIGNDERFFFFDPAKPAQNYNYNANQRLIDAIAKGYRGAYWDILRRLGSIPQG